MNSFYKLIASILKESEAFSGHTSFRVADPTAVGENPIRELTLDAVSLDGDKVMVTLSWEGGEKAFEKTLSSTEAKHIFTLISSDLAEAVSLTAAQRYDEAKKIMENILKQYSESTDIPIPTNMPKLNTTQSSENFDGLWKQAKATIKNTFQTISFDSPEELMSYQEKMKKLQPNTSDQDHIPLWDKENPSKGEDKHEIAPPSISYEQMEKDKAKDTKNLDKRIKEEVKDQIQSSLDEKKATLFTDKDTDLVDAFRNHGRTWDEIKKYMVKELSYDKESVDLYIDDLRQKEEGVSPVPEAPGAVPPELKPPTDLVSPETHDKLLKDHEEKKTLDVKEPKFTPKEIMDIPEEPEIEEESSIARADNSDIRKIAEPHAPLMGRECDICGKGGEIRAYQLGRGDDQSEWHIHPHCKEKKASQDKVALNPLQEPPVQTQPTTPNQDTVPMEKPMAHPALQNGDRVFVSSDLPEEKAGFEGIFISEYQSKGTKFSIVETDKGELIDVESHRVVKTSERPTQEADPSMEPKIEMPKGDEISVTPKLSDLTSEKKCPKCGENIWDVAGGGTTGAKLNKCWNCGLAFDNPESDLTSSVKPKTDKGVTKECPKCKKETHHSWDPETLITFCDICGHEGETHSAEKFSPLQREELYAIKAEIENLDKIVKEAESQVIMPMMYGIDDDSIIQYANGSIYKNKIDSNQMADKDWESLLKDTARWMTQVGRESVSQTFSQDAEWKLDPEQINKLKSMFSVLPKSSAQEKAADAPVLPAEHICEQCNQPMGYQGFLGPVCEKCVKKNHKKVTGTDKQADPQPAVEPAPKTQFKDLKISPKDVDKEKAVPATPEIEQTIMKMNSLQSKLATLDKAKEDIKNKMMEELKKIDVAGERSQAEKELQEAYEKMNVLINATESKIIQWSDTLYTLQTKEEEVVPKPTQKELLEKIYAKFDGAEKYVESVLNGFKSLAKHFTTQTVVRWPKRSAQEATAVTKEASVMDDLDQMNTELMEALKLLSGSVA